MTLSQAILATLAYHDIFDYPLTPGEIHKYLIGKKTGLLQVQKELAKLKARAAIEERRGFFLFKNRTKLVATRLQRSKHSQAKLKKARLFSKLLTLTPTIKLIAVSGALAMDNSHKKDDIDLVIIAQQGTLWTTRFLANIILFPFKRKPPQLQTTNYKLPTNNKACLNLFLDESNLQIRPQNLYMAHEICQMKPLWDKGETYSRFIKANSWVKKYLPNWEPSLSIVLAPPSVIPAKAGIHKNRKTANRSLVSGYWQLVEILLKKFQLFYMRSKISTERIGEHQLFFHPTNIQEWVMEEYNKSLIRLGISNGKIRK